MKIFQKVERGWDPIPAQYAETYAETMYAAHIDFSFIDKMKSLLESDSKITLLDIGAGPGHISIEFAKRGYCVTWHDISINYLNIARLQADRQNIPINFSLGYMEDAKGKYDIIFLSQCWNYCMSDTFFAKKLVSLVKDKGIIYATINNERFFRRKNADSPPFSRWVKIFQFLLNDVFNLKTCHIYPSHNKIVKIFKKLDKIYGFKKCSIERSGHYTNLLIKK